MNEISHGHIDEIPQENHWKFGCVRVHAKMPSFSWNHIKLTKKQHFVNWCLGKIEERIKNKFNNEVIGDITRMRSSQSWKQGEANFLFHLQAKSIQKEKQDKMHR